MREYFQWLFQLFRRIVIIPEYQVWGHWGEIEEMSFTASLFQCFWDLPQLLCCHLGCILGKQRREMVISSEPTNS